MSCLCGDSECPSCGLAQGTLPAGVTYPRDVQDRAREWVNEWKPDLDGDAWERAFEDACAEIADIDAEADEAEE